MACVPNLTTLELNSVFREIQNRGYGQLTDDCGVVWTKVDPNDPIGVINVKAYPYGAIGDGLTHPLSTLYTTLGAAQAFYQTALALTDEIDTVAIQKAINTAAGKTVYIPSGTYRINRQLSYVPSSGAFLNPSLRLFGDGINNTILQTGVNTQACLKLDTSANLKFQHNAQLKDFTITALGVPAAADGIEIRKCYLTEIQNVLIYGLTGSGLNVITTAGDLDAPILIDLKNFYVTDCATWGMNFQAADATSGAANVSVKNVYVARCGTFGVVNSGGVKWHGTMFKGENWAITVCENYGLWLAPNTTAGQSNCFITENLDVEHNKAKSIVIESCSCFYSVHTQILNNPAVSPLATHGIYIDGNAANKLASSIFFINTNVRVTTLNFTAFQAIGANVNTIDTVNTRWDTFDLSGQKRFVDDGVAQWHIDDEGIEYPQSEALIDVGLGVFNFTATAATDLINAVAHNFNNGDTIRFTTTVTLPAPLLAGVDYTVINKTANDFQVTISITGNPIAAGTPIDITTAGAGVHSVASSYAPDLRRYKIFRIRLATGGGAAYVVATPITAPIPGASHTGKIIVIDIYNNSGGAVAVTFGGLITQVGYTNPGNGLRRSSMFYYNALEGLVQIGAWSA